MKVVYHSPADAIGFDINRYVKSLNKYGKVSKEQIEESLKKLPYGPIHVSVLVELGTQLIEDEGSALEYYQEHKVSSQSFERLRRITGYLVGSLERWNDGKKAEEHDRVKHNV